ncbi:hypothetical protein HBH70_119610 [Parastagonospora nodorum]|uniref:Uncharacterized protein n=1 Tax=Phaeosphaeria nodorum (strain SN15 / ATCC MYA-4574 / FGSC 10173) TaxID=321614 RepID=Q0UV61_PHANO|nr:hypothetical protein SNOG_04353 [Parastagonospora nodorum SN15]KAH3989608.1 hypothetical protein HBH52_017560 [Parastagonospora nodorum]EAT88113.1 hypothetical protein SNOG_04353 [Parastagonospora nodorum SN15]KAH3998390.1 hypothetical protein HBI10_130440 [Parastagonospora nodorum]KAH4095978.1 hypothetical protein HBH48_050720 [Parastagonospora nodorum]KAH4120533.1 hypothetical protein HBH47_111590 [Parastagonospora nodorum]
MLFQSQVLPVFLALAAVTHAAAVTKPDRLEKYAHAKEPCTPEEVGFCQTYVQTSTWYDYRDCRHFGAKQETTHGELGPMCVYDFGCPHYCNDGDTGYILAPRFVSVIGQARYDLLRVSTEQIDYSLLESN